MLIKTICPNTIKLDRDDLLMRRHWWAWEASLLDSSLMMSCEQRFKIWLRISHEPNDFHVLQAPLLVNNIFFFHQLLSTATATASLTLKRTANEVRCRTHTAGQKAVTAVWTSPIISVTKNKLLAWLSVGRKCKNKSYENAFRLVKILRINLCSV